MDKIFDEIRKNAVKIMRETLKEIKTQVDEYTPEDTKTLVGANTIVGPAWEGRDRLVGKVENKTPYAVYVEYGRNTKPSRYYKNGGRKRGGTPFYVWYGARMYRRTADKLEEKIIANFENIGDASVGGNFKI